MIPPLPDVRRRTISRWLKDQGQSPSSPEALDRRVSELDDAMMDVFSRREDSLTETMMKAGTWGTPEGMRTFPTDRMTLWSEVVSEFLAPTSAPQSEA